MNFAGVHSVTIPEGDVKSIAFGGVTVWEKRVWPTPLYTGVFLVGSSVQNNNGILSGFTGSSYATMPFFWTAGASQIEAVVRFTSTGTSSSEGIWGCVGSANAFTPFYHQGSSSLGAFLSTNGTSWGAAPFINPGTVVVRYQSGSFVDPAAGDYVLKFTQDGGTVRAYSWSGSAWTKHSEVSFGTIYGASNLVPQLGTNRGQNNPFLGTIDLNYTYLYRDGELWWEGSAGAYRNVKTTYPD